MVKVIFIFFEKNRKKLLYNLSLLDSFCRKNNYELICITKKDNKDYIIKIKNKFNVKFYLVEKERDVRKIKFNDILIIIYNSLDFNLKEIKKALEKIKEKEIILFKNKNLINPYIIIGKDIKVYEKFILGYFLEKKEYIKSNYRIRNILYTIIINLFINIKNTFNLLDHLLKRKYIKDYINEKIGLISYKLITFFLTVILARILTPEFYGSYVTIYNFISIFSSFIGSSNMILEKTLLENINNIEDQKKYIKVDLYLKVIFTLISIIIVMILAPLLLKNIFYSYNIIAIYISIIISILIALDGIGFSIFYSYLKIKEARNLYLLEAIFKFIFIVSLSLILKNYGFIFGLLLTYLIFDIIILSLIIKQYPDLIKFFKEKIDKNIFKKYINLIFKISLPPLLFNLYTSLDIQILRIFTNFQDVGIFYNALIIVATTSSIFSLSNITLPRILRWETKDIKNRIYKIIGLQIIINLIIYGLLILIAPYIILLFFGPSYLLSAELIKYLGIILIIQSFNLFSLILFKSGLEKYYTLYSISSSLLSILLDLILIPRFKLEGAVASAILGNLFNVLIAYIIYEKKFNIITTRSFS